MSEPIFETVVTTVAADGRPHIAPMGVRYRPGQVLLMPFKPSTTLDNILATGAAVLNRLTDVRVFAGCVTGRRDWPLVPLDGFPGQRLGCALSHLELRVAEVQDDPQRPLLTMATGREAAHAPFIGLNRAQAAVVEGAVLVSRLHLLPAERIDREFAYLRIAIDRSAGDAEREAFGWLTDAVRDHRERVAADGAAHG
jgi:uncharacterized protein